MTGAATDPAFMPRMLVHSSGSRPRYTIYAAVEEEYDKGWVWVLQPSLASRTLVKLEATYKQRPRKKKWVTYCEVRRIDWNFIGRYETPERERSIIDVPANAMVLSQWYRNALGDFPTSAYVDTGEIPQIRVIPLQRIWKILMPWWALRAASHHPDIAVRVGTRLGVLGAWIGFVGMLPPMFDHREPIWRLIRDNLPASLQSGVLAFLAALTEHGRFLSFFLFFAVIAALIGAGACWGPSRPPSTEPRTSDEPEHNLKIRRERLARTPSCPA